jgi:hypothetical protein
MLLDMEYIVRTTLTIDSHVLAEFKKEAAESHRTLSSLIEATLREHLSRRRDTAASKPLEFPMVGGYGVAKGVDLSSNAVLQAYLNEGEAPDAGQPRAPALRARRRRKYD